MIMPQARQSLEPGFFYDRNEPQAPAFENTLHMEKNYNLYRKKLLLPEYGRHIHQMVDNVLKIEDRAERSRQARMVIDVMGNLFPMIRDSADFKHKLWDHLFIMADFKLDVDSPYPIPTEKALSTIPLKMAYPDKRVAQKHYGKIVPTMIRAISRAGNSPQAQEAIGNIARYMRTKSYEYNQEHPNNEVIIKDIKKMSENTIQMDEVALNNLKSEYKQPQTIRGKKNVHPKKNVRNQKNGQHRPHAKG